MVAHDERQKLLRDYCREPVWSLAVVLKCAACLVLLIAISIIGTTSDTQRETGASVQAGGSAHQQRAAMVESRNGFDASRARLEVE